jgi:hypothetical protein
MIGRSLNDNDAEMMNLRQQLDAKKIENSQLASSIREMRTNFKEAEN